MADDSVRQQLERILSQSPMVSSPSLSRLLRFLVEETLAGRAESLNENRIGLQVFQRSPEFNPRTDPIVRVQTHHLRSRLTRYYAWSGVSDPIVIELPPRTYVPVFREVVAVAPAVEVQAAVDETRTPAPPAVIEESRAVGHGRSPAAVAGVMVLVTLAAFALLGHSGPVKARNMRYEADPAAQDLYIRGRYLLDRQTESAIRQGIECFQKSTARDPHFAAAFAGLSDAQNLLVQYGYAAPHDGMEEARRAARQALALDPDLAEAHVSLASILEAYDWDFQRAEREYRRAIQLNPELPAAHLWYGMFLRDQNRLAEALPELRRAEQLEPLSVLTNLNLAHTFRMAGDTAAALERAQRAVELDPELPSAGVLLANIYRARSDNPDAEASLSRALDHASGNPHALSIVACTYAQMGDRAKSAALLRQMEQLAAERYVSPYDLANVALLLGDEERAVDWFEAAYRERSAGIVFLRNEKKLTGVHSERLRLLMEKIGRG